MKVNKKTVATLFVTLFFLLAQGFCMASKLDSEEMHFGAITFRERCALCHGNMGMGDGLLPLAIKGYPPTDLHSDKVKINKDMVRLYLTDEDEMSRHQLSPPWHGELNEKQVSALVDFAVLLKNDTDTAITLLKDIDNSVNVDISVSAGHVIYKTRCQVCHGVNGEGDGHLSKVIKNPPPFNLTLSRASDEYLFKFISDGGEKMGRSPSMPPWGEDLSESDLKSVILFINEVIKYKQR